MKITFDIPKKPIARAIDEPRIPIYGIAWQQYESFIEMFSEHPNLHLAYFPKPNFFQS